MKKAVMYGAGNIGRGFIGALFSQSVYSVSFIDIAKPVVNGLNEAHSYPLRLVSGDQKEDYTIKNVSAVDGMDVPAVAEAIATCDIMATAVGVRILELIVPNIVAGIRRRWEIGGPALNIIICENLNNSSRIMEGMIKSLLNPEEVARFDETVGLVEASVGRMVPIQTEEMRDGDPLRVCTEHYAFLPVDKAAFKGEIPEIKGMVPFEPFDFFVKRKLFIHNMGHATTAYLGKILGVGYISQSIDNPYVRIIVQNAMLESARTLSKHYGVDLEWLTEHVSDLLFRFANAALKDTCVRVGADPARKLAAEDRLVGAMRLALTESVDVNFMAVGAAAAMWSYLGENGMAQAMDSCRRNLCALSGLSEGSEIVGLVLEFYRIILDTRSVAELCHAAERKKAVSRMCVI